MIYAHLNWADADQEQAISTIVCNCSCFGPGILILMLYPVLQLFHGPAGVDDIFRLLHSLFQAGGMAGDAEQWGGIKADDVPSAPPLPAA